MSKAEEYRRMILRSATKDLREDLDMIAVAGYQWGMVGRWLKRVDALKVPVYPAPKGELKC